MTNSDDHLIVQNYAAAFIDLLGQRAALEGCELTPNSKEEFIEIVKQSIGAIRNLHNQFNDFYSAINQGPDSSRSETGTSRTTFANEENPVKVSKIF